MSNEIESLRARVEKLKKSNEFVGSIDAIVLASQGKYIITNKMIDEAVDEARDEFAQHGTNRAWLALNKIGIHRCDGCGGSGRPEYPLEGNYGPCPDCAKWGSKGWVINE